MISTSVMNSIVALIVSWLIVGCAGTQQNGELDSENSGANQSVEANAELELDESTPPLRLGVADTIEIKFFYSPELDDIQTVRPDGMISLQLIGDVQVAGYTPMEFADILKERYAGELREPKIVVVAKNFSDYNVYVGGEVASPKIVPLAGRMTALRAIIDAGGFTPTAKKQNVIIIRKGTEDIPVEKLMINMKDVLYAGNTENDILLKPFDIIYVPETTIARLNRFVNQYINQMIPTNLVQVYRDYNFVRFLRDPQERAVTVIPGEDEAGGADVVVTPNVGSDR